MTNRDLAESRVPADLLHPRSFTPGGIARAELEALPALVRAAGSRGDAPVPRVLRRAHSQPSRRRDRRAGQHRVRLPAVVDLMHEQVCEHRVHLLLREPLVAAVEHDLALELLPIERLAEPYEARADPRPVASGPRACRWIGIRARSSSAI
jgi:hypothetical protein